jgi:hypothetical protein
MRYSDFPPSKIPKYVFLVKNKIFFNKKGWARTEVLPQNIYKHSIFYFILIFKKLELKKNCLNHKIKFSNKIFLKFWHVYRFIKRPSGFYIFYYLY